MCWSVRNRTGDRVRLEFVQCVDVDMWKLHIVDPHHPHHLHITYTSSPHHPHHLHITYTSSPHHPHHLHIFNVDIPLHIHISSIFAKWPWRRTPLSLINIVTVKFSSKGFRRLVRNYFSLIPEQNNLEIQDFPTPPQSTDVIELCLWYSEVLRYRTKRLIADAYYCKASETYAQNNSHHTPYRVMPLV